MPKRRKGEEVLPDFTGDAATSEAGIPPASTENGGTTKIGGTNTIVTTAVAAVQGGDKPPVSGKPDIPPLEEGWEKAFLSRTPTNAVEAARVHQSDGPEAILPVAEEISFVRLEEEGQSVGSVPADEPGDSMTEEELQMSFEGATAAILDQYPDGLTEKALEGKPLNLRGVSPNLASLHQSLEELGGVEAASTGQTDDEKAWEDLQRQMGCSQEQFEEAVRRVIDKGGKFEDVSEQILLIMERDQQGTYDRPHRPIGIIVDGDGSGDSLADQALRNEVASVNEELDQRGRLGQPHGWLLRAKENAAWRKKCDEEAAADDLLDPIVDFGDEVGGRRHQPTGAKSWIGLASVMAMVLLLTGFVLVLAFAVSMLFDKMNSANDRLDKVKTEATQVATQTATQVVGEAVTDINEVLQTVVDENVIAHDTFSQRLDGLQAAGRQLQEQVREQVQELTDSRSGVVAQAKLAVRSDIAQAVRQEVNDLKEQLATAQSEVEATKQKLTTVTAETAKAMKYAGTATIKAEEAKKAADKAQDYGSTAIEVVSVIAEQPNRPFKHSVSKDTKEEARGMIAELRARYGTPTATELNAAVERGVSKQVTVKQLPPLPPMKRK